MYAHSNYSSGVIMAASQTDKDWPEWKWPAPWPWDPQEHQVGETTHFDLLDNWKSVLEAALSHQIEKVPGGGPQRHFVSEDEWEFIIDKIFDRDRGARLPAFATDLTFLPGMVEVMVDNDDKSMVARELTELHYPEPMVKHGRWLINDLQWKNVKHLFLPNMFMITQNNLPMEPAPKYIYGRVGEARQFILHYVGKHEQVPWNDLEDAFKKFYPELDFDSVFEPLIETERVHQPVLGQIAFGPEKEGGPPKPAPEPAAVPDRNTVIIERVGEPDFIVKRGDTVRVWIRKDYWIQDKVIGISHAKRQIKVGNLWHEFARIYPLSRAEPVAVSEQPAAPSVKFEMLPEVKQLIDLKLGWEEHEEKLRDILSISIAALASRPEGVSHDYLREILIAQTLSPDSADIIIDEMDGFVEEGIFKYDEGTYYFIELDRPKMEGIPGVGPAYIDAVRKVFMGEADRQGIIVGDDEFKLFIDMKRNEIERLAREIKPMGWVPDIQTFLRASQRREIVTPGAPERPMISDQAEVILFRAMVSQLSTLMLKKMVETRRWDDQEIPDWGIDLIEDILRNRGELPRPVEDMRAVKKAVFEKMADGQLKAIVDEHSIDGVDIDNATWAIANEVYLKTLEERITIKQLPLATTPIMTMRDVRGDEALVTSIMGVFISELGVEQDAIDVDKVTTFVHQWKEHKPTGRSAVINVNTFVRDMFPRTRSHPQLVKRVGGIIQAQFGEQRGAQEIGEERQPMQRRREPKAAPSKATAYPGMTVPEIVRPEDVKQSRQSISVRGHGRVDRRYAMAMGEQLWNRYRDSVLDQGFENIWDRENSEIAVKEHPKLAASLKLPVYIRNIMIWSIPYAPLPRGVSMKVQTDQDRMGYDIAREVWTKFHPEILTFGFDELWGAEPFKELVESEFGKYKEQPNKALVRRWIGEIAPPGQR